MRRLKLGISLALVYVQITLQVIVRVYRRALQVDQLLHPYVCQHDALPLDIWERIHTCCQRDRRVAAGKQLA
jgi:hypothetical protein